MRTMLVVVSMAAVTPALAQTPQDKAAAEALFREGRDLAKQGKHAEACPKFEGSQKLDPSAGTLLNLGDCYEKVGRTTSAWATFEEARTFAKRVGDARKQQEAQKRAAALEPKLARIAIDVPAESRVPGLEIRRDGSVVPEVSWGTAVPVDPGAHEIVASAPGRVAWTTKVEAAAGGTGKVSVPVLGEEKQAGAGTGTSAPSASPSPLPTTSTSPSTSTTSSTSTSPSTTGRGKRIAGMAVAGAGVVVIGVGTYFAISASSNWSDAKALCASVPRDCSLEATRLGDDAATQADLATLFLGVGAAAIAGGAYLYFTAPSSEAATALRLTPTRSGAAVWLEGRF